MKNLLMVMALAALGGCVVALPGPAYYGSRAPAYDPYQWHVVSAEPAPVYASRVEYSNEPVYATQPVYVQQPVYMGAPMYAPQPYYYGPPVTIGLDFMFGGWYGRGHGWGHGYRGRR
ncbi:hypothetical protein AAKU55_004681 [Oxalobacteraceae bacterium GrIS 1.11]